MELVNYLNENFFTQQQLLALSKISEQQLLSFQDQDLMPKCAYKLNLNLTCDSFFGEFQEQQTIEYYAKGYTAWLGVVELVKNQNDLFNIFSMRYKRKIKELKAQGFACEHPKINEEIDSHIKEEWQHFLDGIYGLCTKSGLPEDIAAKELAILEINQLIETDNLDASSLAKLESAVDLLDAASSMFAPHERLKSSRFRLVDEIRRQYKLAKA